LLLARIPAGMHLCRVNRKAQALCDKPTGLRLPSDINPTGGE